MTERCKSCDHDTQVHAPDGSGCLYEIKTVGIAADRICTCTLDAYRKPRCKASEGCTGIDCALPAGHQGEHEGTHKAGGEHDGVGYDLFVRWPYQPWDIEHGIAPNPAEEKR